MFMEKEHAERNAASGCSCRLWVKFNIYLFLLFLLLFIIIIVYFYYTRRVHVSCSWRKNMQKEMQHLDVSYFSSTSNLRNIVLTPPLKVQRWGDWLTTQGRNQMWSPKFGRWCPGSQAEDHKKVYEKEGNTSPVVEGLIHPPSARRI